MHDQRFEPFPFPYITIEGSTIGFSKGGPYSFNSRLLSLGLGVKNSKLANQSLEIAVTELRPVDSCVQLLQGQRVWVGR